VINRPTTFTTQYQAAACGGLLCALVSLDHLPSVISKQLPLVGNFFETSLKLGGGGM
jgi:hypothetical protein